MFIKDKTKVAYRMSGIERRVVYFRQLLFVVRTIMRNSVLDS